MIILFLIGCASNLNTIIKPPEVYRVIITTGLDRDERPINDIEEMSLNEEKVFIYTKWNLPIKTYDYKCVITDGAGKIAYSSYEKMRPFQTRWNFYSGCIINKNIDNPGLWKFEVYLDSVKYVEKTIRVTGEKNAYSSGLNRKDVTSQQIDEGSLTYDEFLQRASHPLRSDSVVALHIDEIQTVLEPYLLKNCSLFKKKSKNILTIQIYPSGLVRLTNYNDSTGTYSSVIKSINDALLKIKFDSIPNYSAIKQIEFCAQIDSNLIKLDKIFTSQFVSGGRSKASILRVTMINLAELRRMYTKRLKEKRGLDGRITVRFAIDEYGKVIACKVESTTIHDKKMENEVVRQIYTWEFGKINKPGDVTEVVYPFVFSQ